MSTTADLTAAQVMDSSAALMNDVAKSVYTYVAQIPYLNIAVKELQEYFEANDIPVTETISAVITIAAGTDHVGFTTGATPKLPDDLVEPEMLWERQSGVNPYVPMTRVNTLPESLLSSLTPQFVWYVWETQQIKFLAATQDNDILMNYKRAIFTRVTASTDTLNVINADSFLSYRTAGLCAEFIGENKTRADSLNGDATAALDRAINIGSKGRQSIVTRRRPFRSAYKQRSFN